MLRALLILSFTLLLIGAVLAAPQDDDTIRLYESGVDLLRGGKNLNKAIQRLETVVRREPENAQYQSALACAFASRFAFVALAAKEAEKYDAARQFYEKMTKQWDEDQKDPAGRLNGLPEPKPPPAVITLDDGLPFAVSPYDARKELLRLGHRAQNAFESARRKAGSLSAKGKVQLEFARGWGLLLLRRFGEGWVLDVVPKYAGEFPSETMPLAIPPEEATESFKKCIGAVADDPDDIDYRYSLAVSHASFLLSLDGFQNAARPEGSRQDDKIKAAVTDLKKVLAKKSTHRGAAYAMGLLHMLEDLALAAEDFERTAQLEPNNAARWYQAAETRFEQAEKEEGDAALKTLDQAVRLAARGNSAATLRSVFVDIPAPVLLRYAWALAEAYGVSDGYISVNLAWNVGKVGQDAEKQGNSARAADAYKIECEVGRHLIAAMDCADLDLRLPYARHMPSTRRQFGGLHFVTGYQRLDKLNQKQPDAGIAGFLASNRDVYARAKVLERISY